MIKIKKYSFIQIQVGIGLGAVLKQPRDNGILQPIAYFSRKLKLTESKKKAFHLECLVIKEAILYWQHCLIGRNFTVLSFSLIIFEALLFMIINNYLHKSWKYGFTWAVTQLSSLVHVILTVIAQNWFSKFKKCKKCHSY